MVAKNAKIRLPQTKATDDIIMVISSLCISKASFHCHYSLRFKVRKAKEKKNISKDIYNVLKKTMGDFPRFFAYCEKGGGGDFLAIARNHPKCQLKINE
jgi:thymidylate synthase ThyX